MRGPLPVHVALPPFSRVQKYGVIIEPREQVQLIDVCCVVVPPRDIRTDAQCEMSQVVEAAAARVEQGQ